MEVTEPVGVQRAKLVDCAVNISDFLTNVRNNTNFCKRKHKYSNNQPVLAHVCMAGLLAQSWLSLVAVAVGNQMGAMSQARHLMIIICQKYSIL